MEPAPDVKRLRKRANDFHHGDLRAAAVEAAIREVEKHGHLEVSLERIATRLGVTRPALYRHFADKRALLVEVAHRGFERFEEALTAAFTAKTDVWEALHALGRTYVEFACANAGWFRLQFSHPVPQPDRERTPARYAPMMLDELTRALGNRADGEAAYRSLWGIAHGLAALVIEGVPLPYDDSLRIHVRALAAYAGSQTP